MTKYLKLELLFVFAISICNSQNNTIKYDLFEGGKVFKAHRCINEDFNFSSAIIKITGGDSNTIKSTSVLVVFDDKIEEYFNAITDFNAFNFKNWLLTHFKNQEKAKLTFDFITILKNNKIEKQRITYCIKHIKDIILGETNSGSAYVKLPVFFATDRNYVANEDFDEQFGYKRDKLKYGVTQISIPKTHKIGEIESPSYWRLEFWEDPKKHIVVHSINLFNKYNFFSKLSKAVNKSDKKNSFLFIHGYNVSFIDAAKRTAQIAYDLKFDGAPVFYSWPSHADTGAYTRDEVNIDWSKKNIEHFLKDYLSTKTNAENIYLIAHSMGNRGLTKAVISVVSENPNLKSKIKEIILAAPDIDADIFKRDIAPKMVSTVNKPITLYVSSEDLALKASHLVHGNPRAGDSKRSIVVIDGIETIDASGIDTSFLGHSYFSDTKSILTDIYNLIESSKRATFRKQLKEIKYLDGKFWKFKK